MIAHPASVSGGACHGAMLITGALTAAQLPKALSGDRGAEIMYGQQWRRCAVHAAGHIGFTAAVGQTATKSQISVRTFESRPLSSLIHTQNDNLVRRRVRLPLVITLDSIADGQRVRLAVVPKICSASVFGQKVALCVFALWIFVYGAHLSFCKPTPLCDHVYARCGSQRMRIACVYPLNFQRQHSGLKSSLIPIASCRPVSTPQRLHKRIILPQQTQPARHPPCRGQTSRGCPLLRAAR